MENLTSNQIDFISPFQYSCIEVVLNHPILEMRCCPQALKVLSHFVSLPYFVFICKQCQLDIKLDAPIVYVLVVLGPSSAGQTLSVPKNIPEIKNVRTVLGNQHFSVFLRVILILNNNSQWLNFDRGLFEFLMLQKMLLKI